MTMKTAFRIAAIAADGTSRRAYPTCLTTAIIAVCFDIWKYGFKGAQLRPNMDSLILSARQRHILQLNNFNIINIGDYILKARL